MRFQKAGDCTSGLLFFVDCPKRDGPFPRLAPHAPQAFENAAARQRGRPVTDGELPGQLPALRAR